MFWLGNLYQRRSPGKGNIKQQTYYVQKVRKRLTRPTMGNENWEDSLLKNTPAKTSGAGGGNIQVSDCNQGGKGLPLTR